MFFVVDVETSDTEPWKGELLSVGIVGVTEDGEIDDGLYLRLKHSAFLPAHNRTSTQEFWAWQAEDNPEAYYEAFLEPDRVSIKEGMLNILDYVTGLEPDENKRFVAANPVAFDKMWLQWAFHQVGVTFPFHYRCLCLRSMRFGLEDDSTFGSRKGTQKPKVEHHAYNDAIAEAFDLQEMINKKKDKVLEQIGVA